jgi:hypothetical protein
MGCAWRSIFKREASCVMHIKFQIFMALSTYEFFVTVTQT